MPAKDVYEMFREQVRHSPDRTAVSDESTVLTFQELDTLASAVSDRIPEGTRRVGLAMDHSTLMIASILGILRAGAAFVPEETDSPVQRTRAVFEAAHVDLVFTSPQNTDAAGTVPALVPQPDWERTAHQPSRHVGPDAPAYIVFSSGRAPEPSGVIATNANVLHCAAVFEHEFRVGQDDVMVQQSACTSDIFMEEVFCSLLNGAELVIAPEHVRDRIEHLNRFLEDRGVTVVAGTPYLMLGLNGLERIAESVRLLVSSGDVLRLGYVDNLFHQAQVYNTYGPSEAAACAAYYRCLPENALTNGTFPVGYPTVGSDLRIIDSRGVVEERGNPGELLITGDGVTAGYAGGEGAGTFVQWNGEKAFRTGDLGYQNEDGAVIFTRRRGTQVMIRGRHVEPGEIEHVLCGMDGIATARVLAARDESGLAYLTAYIVPADPYLTCRRISRELQGQLPRYMIPEFIVRMNEFPLGPDGRPDVRAFPVVMKEGRL